MLPASRQGRRTENIAYQTTYRAGQDIIALYVRGTEAFGTDQAESYHLGLIETFDLLTDNSQICREHTEFTPPVRLHSYRSHLIVYRIEGSHILIVRILHGRQDWEQLL